MTHHVYRPRVSLDEFTARLHSALSGAALPLSLDHIRALAVDALGYSGEDPSEFWDGMDEPSSHEQRSLDVLVAIPHYEQYVAQILEALQGVRTGSRSAMSHLDQSLEGLKELIRGLPHNSTANFLLDKARDAVKQAPCQVAFPDEDLLSRLDRWVERIGEHLDPLFFPGRVHLRAPIPKGLLPKHATLVGDWGLLDKALGLLRQDEQGSEQDFERYQSVRVLCDWWNTHAPEGSRHAGAFFIHQLDPDQQHLSILGYGECPETQIEDFTSSGEYALFEKPGRPPLAIGFIRGRANNQYIDRATHVFNADGSLCWDIGCPPSEVDEVAYSVRGLRQLV